MCQSKVKLNFRFATENDTQDVIKLWNLCFPDDSGFNEYFFSNIYKPEYNLLLFKDNILCSMAQMLPYKMQNGNEMENITYIYGACTHPHYRRQHLMDKLLNHSFEIDRNLKRNASVLIPQEQWLFGFYEQFGYKPMLKLSYEQISSKINTQKDIIIKEAQTEDISQMQMLYISQIKNNVYYLIRNHFEWERQIAMFKACGSKAVCMYDNNQIIGYAFIWLENDNFYAQEFVFKPEYKEICIYNLQKYLNLNNCKLCGLQFSNLYPLGSIKRYDNKAIDCGYINLMLN